MLDMICPKCKSVISVIRNTGNIICPKCLATNGESVIMIQEQQSTPKIRNLGDGFFQKEKE